VLGYPPPTTYMPRGLHVHDRMWVQLVIVAVGRRAMACWLAVRDWQRGGVLDLTADAARHGTHDTMIMTWLC